MEGSDQEDIESEEEVTDSDDDDETIARIQRNHYAQAAAIDSRKRPPARPRRMSQKRKLEAVRDFHDFTKKLKKDTGISIRGLVGNNMLSLSGSSSDESESESDGLPEEEFVVNPDAVKELNEENESYIDPETGDFVTGKTDSKYVNPVADDNEKVPKTLSICDIINESDLDLTKNVEIAEVEGSELGIEKTAEELLDLKEDEHRQNFDPNDDNTNSNSSSLKKEESEIIEVKKSEEEEKKINPNALNVRRNIREVMDEKNLDASTLTAQRQESERLARVQEQQRIIREVQKQIAINRQNKLQQKSLSLLQGSSILKKSIPGSKIGLQNTVLVKLPSGEVKRTALKPGQMEMLRLSKLSSSNSMQKVAKPEQTDKREVVEIVDSSSGDESSSSTTSDSDDCIMLSDSEVPASPEAADEDPNNSGLHVNDTYNIPDEQGRVLINIGHAENEEDIFLAPQIARVIKPHQIGGVRFLFDNIIESVERFSTSSGFGCILAHSMGLGKTLQIVCFCDIFLRSTKSKTVLCIMPINTLQNWVAEFNMWLPLDATNSPLAAHGEVRPRNFPIYVLNDSHKTLQMRAKVVKDWSSTGGVLMIGYELYRLLSMKKDKKPRKKKKAESKNDTEKDKEETKTEKNEESQSSETISNQKPPDSSKNEEKDNDAQNNEESRDEIKNDTPNEEEKKLLDDMYEALVKPGPDLVICDEGHRIKNSHSNISYALKQMRTKRRVVLTGYPLQNNLLEYWCMVDFVRPNYLGSKTEFCNMFERPIQNGQCIDSTPQDIRLMRYRAHVLHSLLLGFVQRRSHAVLQSTLPQKEEYVLLIRMTPLQRQLYDRFMNEVVRSTAVPNPLRAFAICCKIWNHPDVLYNYLKKRSEANMAIEDDLDLEELRGNTKAGRAKSSRTSIRRPAKPRGTTKKPAATIQPNTTTATKDPLQDPNTYGNPPYPASGQYTPISQQYKQDQSNGNYQQYHNTQNSGYYPPNQSYDPNYSNNYYPPQQPLPSYPNNYTNQYSENNANCAPGYNQNYWNNGNYFNNQGNYNNASYSINDQIPQASQAPGYNNVQQYPQNYHGNTNDPHFVNNTPNFTDNLNYQNPSTQFSNSYPNQPGYSEFNSNNAPGYYPGNSITSHTDQPYNAFNPNTFENKAPPLASYNQLYNNQPNSFNEHPNNLLSTQHHNETKTSTEADYHEDKKPNLNINPQSTSSIYDNNVIYNPSGPTPYPQHEHNNSTYSTQYPNFPSHLETKQPLSSAESGSPLPSWPITEVLKTEVDKLKNEEKLEIKSESDGEVKIEDLDTKKIVKDELKSEAKVKIENTPLNDSENKIQKDEEANKNNEVELENGNDSKKKQKPKKKERKKPEKSPVKGKSKLKDKKDLSKGKNDEVDSEDSEKEDKLTREEELAMVKKAEEMTYDWATDLLKDYVPGLIENSSKMILFFQILNESIKLGDRMLLFSQSLFTLNLIEDFLEKNYIPGTNTYWERNTNYYRLDGSTHALEREKLINEFNANPHIYLFLVSTRAGSLGINLVGANRVIVFDASWNPCHDTQAVCRVYRYGQRKPCFVYRFVMDWCLEKKIYDRQINKQGMADRVVDECNPDAVLSMKEITNLCFDNDEKESAPKDLSEHKDKYLDVVMQGIITNFGKLLSKEPFQHESLLVDRKEKKLSSAEKRLAQRGYELEKKAATCPKSVYGRAGAGGRPVASVRPMQHGARWIPADVWRRQGMTAQEMTLPLDVVIPTNSAEKTNIVLKAGQRVMVLKSPKGIYMQLESGKIIAIKTSLKGIGQKTENNSLTGKKVIGNRPSSIPGSLKNNSAITITSKSSVRPGLQRVLSRPQVFGQNKIVRPMTSGQKIADFRNRMSDVKSYSVMRSKLTNQNSKIVRPNLPGSVSITKITKDKNGLEGKNGSSSIKSDSESDDDETEILDSDEENSANKEKNDINEAKENKKSEHLKGNVRVEDASHDSSKKEENTEKSIVLTTDEKLPTEEALSNTDKEETKCKKNVDEQKRTDSEKINPSQLSLNAAEQTERKTSLLKNYRHQRLINKSPAESTLSQLEKTASTLNKEAAPHFRQNLDDITQSYSPTAEDAGKAKKKKQPIKVDLPRESAVSENKTANSSNMAHSVSNLLGNCDSMHKSRQVVDPTFRNMAPVAPIGHNINAAQAQNESVQVPQSGFQCKSQTANVLPMVNPGSMKAAIMPSVGEKKPSSAIAQPMGVEHPSHIYPSANPIAESGYGQYPGFGMGYGAYAPPSAPYLGYPGVPYYPPYGAPPAPGCPPAHPATDPYLPPNPQW